MNVMVGSAHCVLQCHSIFTDKNCNLKRNHTMSDNEHSNNLRARLPSTDDIRTGPSMCGH